MTIFKFADVFSTFAEAIMFFMLFETFLKRREGRGVLWYGAGIVVLTVLLAICNYFFLFNVSNGVSMILMAFVVSYLYDGSMKSRIAIAFIVFVIFSSVEMIVLYGITLVLHLTVQEAVYIPTYRLLGIILSKFLGLAVCNSIRLKGRRQLSNLQTTYWVLFVLLFANAVFVAFLIFQMTYELGNEDYNDLAAVASFGLFLSAFFALYLYERLVRQNETIRRQTQYEEHLKSQLKHLDEMLLQQKALRRFKHDVSNQLIALDGYLERQDYAGGRAYLHAVASQMPALGDTVDTGNTALDAILSTKMALAKSKGIDFTLKTQIPAQLPVAPVDLCVIYGNTIDNAIEACDRVRGRKRRIAVSIVQEGTALLCQIANTAPDDIHPDLHTSKGDSDNHGFGLMNVRESLEKYGSELRIVQSDGEFILSFMIFLQAQPPEK